jgi:hypothetical protein
MPKIFPGRQYPDIDPIRGWQGWFHVAADYEPVPNVRVEATSMQGELLRQLALKDFDSDKQPAPNAIFHYDNPLGDRALLPRAFIRSDSFFYKGAQHLNPTIFPYFHAVTYYYNDFKIDGWDDAEIVILSTSDQSARGLASVVNVLAYRAETRTTRSAAGVSCPRASSSPATSC